MAYILLPMGFLYLGQSSYNRFGSDLFSSTQMGLKIACADQKSFVKKGPTSTTFFKFDEGRKDQNTTISGPSNAGLVALCS